MNFQRVTMFLWVALGFFFITPSFNNLQLSSQAYAIPPAWGPIEENNTAIRTLLLEAYDTEIKQYPEFKNFLLDENGKPFKGMAFFWFTFQQQRYNGIPVSDRLKMMRGSFDASDRNGAYRKNEFSKNNGINEFIKQLEDKKLAVAPKPLPPVESLAPVITKVPASVEVGENVAIYGKNFIRVGGTTEFFNVKDVFWVSGNKETKAEEVRVAGNPQEEDKINIKAPSKIGNYSLKVVTAKGTAVWDKLLVAVQDPTPPVTQEIKAYPYVYKGTFEENTEEMKRILLMGYEQEIKKYPGLKGFLTNVNGKPFKAMVDVYFSLNARYAEVPMTDCIKMGRAVLSDPTRKAAFSQYNGINNFIDREERRLAGEILKPEPKENGPMITNISSDIAQPGEKIFISGEKFDGFQGAYYGATLMGCKYKLPTEIECYIPENITGDGTIKVVTTNGEAVYRKQLIASLNPQITQIKPDPSHPGSYYIHVGDKITIVGKNFIDIKEVNFDNREYVLLGGKAISVTKKSRTEVEVIVPNISSGAYTLKVKTAKGEAKYGGLEILTRPGLSIISVSPMGRSSSTIGREEMIMIYGKGFKNVLSVNFISGNSVQTPKELIFISEQQMNMRTPKEAGSYALKIKTEWGEVERVITVDTMLPTILSIFPAGNRLGQPAVIEGSNLSQVTKVEINGKDESFNKKIEKDSDPRFTTIELRHVKWGMDQADLNKTVTVITAYGEKASKPLISPRVPVVFNAEGHEEKCFPAVGNACSGKSEDYTKEDSRIYALDIFPVTGGCSIENDHGWKNCYVVPGSIKHDNCCLRHPLGYRCGGTFTEGPHKGKKAGKPKGAPDWDAGPYENYCLKEWDDASTDVQNGRAWLEEFHKDRLADLTPVTSNRYIAIKHNYDVTQEVNESRKFCARDGDTISARHGAGFCCSSIGRLYTMTPPIVEDWIVCGKEPAPPKKAEVPPPKVDFSKPPPNWDLNLSTECRDCYTYPITNTNPLRGATASRSVLGRSTASSSSSRSVQQLSKEGAVSLLYPLVVDKKSSGTIKSSDSQIDCGDAKCLAYYKQGETITLTATPSNENMKLAVWGVEGCISKKDLSCKITMDDKGKVIKPEFKKLDTFMLTIERPRSGKIVTEDGKINCGTSQCFSEHKEGYKVTLKAVPDSEHEIKEWTGACTGADLQCTFVVDENKKVGASFVASKPPVKDIPVADESKKQPASKKDSQSKEPESASHEGIKPTIPEKQTPPSEKEGPQEVVYCDPDVPTISQRGCVERESSGEAGKKEAPICDSSVPMYMQRGCVEGGKAPASQDKQESPTSGQACDPTVPMMNQRGCVEQ